jgi:hypothetical protein
MAGRAGIWRLLNMPCEGMTRLASESLDRELSRVERLALRCHFICCAACRRFGWQVEFLSHAARRIGGVAPLSGPRLPDDVRERIRRALRED